MTFCLPLRHLLPVLYIFQRRSRKISGDTDNGEMTECIDSSRVAASPATCSLLSFDRVHVPLMVARADPADISFHL